MPCSSNLGTETYFPQFPLHDTGREGSVILEVSEYVPVAWFQKNGALGQWEKPRNYTLMKSGEGEIEVLEVFLITKLPLKYKSDWPKWACRGRNCNPLQSLNTKQLFWN